MTTLPYLEVPVTADTEHFWAELGEGRFTVPWCSRCNSWVWHPKPICNRCLEPADGERTLEGTGTVYSFSIVHRGSPKFGDVGGPYVLSYVTLDGGPTVLSNVIGEDALQVRIGDRVRLVSPAEAGAGGGAKVKVGACRFQRIPA